MRTFDIAIKDLQQILRDKRAALFLLIMPIVFTGFMGFALGRPAAGQEDSRLPLGFVNNDASGYLSQNLAALLVDSKTLRVVEATDAAKATEDLRKGSLAGVLIVPQGFSDKTIAGETVKLTLIADMNDTAGQTIQQAVQAIVARVLSVAQIGRLSAERGGKFDTAIAQASDAWSKPQLTVSLEKTTAVKTPADKQVPMAYQQSSPGMMVMFAIFGLVSASTLLVIERRSRTLQRMLTTNISRAEIIAGHMLAIFLIGFVQQVILIAVGQFVFGVNYLREPLAILSVMVALSLWTASLGLFIGAVAKGEEQANLFAMIAMFVFSALGGAWFPVEFTGGAFAAVSRLMPSAWAMTGFQNIIVRELGMTSVFIPIAILLAYAIGFFTLAVWRFRFE